MASRASDYFPIVPYPCLYIDASWRDALSSIPYLRQPDEQRDQIKADIRRIWNSQLPTDDPTHRLLLPCLSVRSAFDIFLSLKRYPSGSEIIMTAINIPQMMYVAQHHGLRVIPLDISIKTLAPKIDLFEALINENTVAVLLAHIYGRWSNLDDVINLCVKHNLTVLEDCAEAFCGFKKLGHPKADLSFFSFGAIKPSTAFGGAIIRVKDPVFFHQMQELHQGYPIQSRVAYMKKVLSCVLGMMALNSPTTMKVCLPIFQRVGFDHKEAVIALLRGFQSDFMTKIRQQPSTALLSMMLRRFQSFDEAKFQEGTKKCDYVREHLPQSLGVIGTNVDTRNYWLFPVIVNDPARVLKALNRRGIDAYRGVTQLICLRPHPGRAPSDPARFDHIATPGDPVEAQYLIDHVIYLPVHKRVPYSYLERICSLLEVIIEETMPCPLKKKVDYNGKTIHVDNGRIKIYSKL